ncbi:MAG: type II/IV secretion system protein [Parcubacteria group bacterium]|nr:type II/IV secretion system protein [Parcubacteria group bacterium]
MITFRDPKQQERYEELHKQEEEELVRVLSARYGVSSVTLSSATVNTDALKLVPEEEARKAGVAPFSLLGKKVKVAVLSPHTNEVKSIVKDLSRRGYEPDIVMVSHNSIEQAWALYPEISRAEETEAGVFDISGTQLESISSDIAKISDITATVGSITEGGSRNKVTRILEALLGGAIAIDASDVHFEPEESGARVRIRVDGVLVDTARLNTDVYAFILSRVKLLSGLKLNVTKNSQDGRFSIRLHDRNIEIRASVIPEEHGESIVLRLLDPTSLGLAFDDLGIDPALFDVIKREISRPNGLILTTGPTGSGKTTSLYAFLKHVHRSEVKIITIENPIEYHLDGITQTQTNTKEGYTFAQGLKTALRQDPDVIMVGEIRDSDTAQTALNAAFTGHLVFSTLHTNNAAGVIPRLVNLGVNPKLISSGLNLSLAQRLVRRVCPHCRRPYEPTEEEKTLMEGIIERFNTKRGTRETLGGHTLYEAHTAVDNTCAECGGLGYKGRIGVYEGILTDESTERVVLSDMLTEREIRKASKEQGIPTMAEDGIVNKVLQGLTSLSELRRVVDLDES